MIHIELTGLTDLPATPLTLLHLQASVPANATYGATHLLDIQELQFNGGALAGSDDDGMHLVAYLGDTDRQARYSAADALRVQRVVVRLDSGFSSYPLVDPLIVGDVNGNGRLDAGDALLIQRKACTCRCRSCPICLRLMPVVAQTGFDPRRHPRRVASAGGQRTLNAGRLVLNPACEQQGDAPSDRSVLAKRLRRRLRSTGPRGRRRFRSSRWPVCGTALLGQATSSIAWAAARRRLTPTVK